MNEQEFLDFWRTIEWPREKTVYYRLYYDDSGLPLFYSHEDQSGKYIDVTPEQFALRDLQVSVVDGVLTPRARPVLPKLVPCATGIPCHINDAAVIVDQEQPHQRWKSKQHEQD
jgi:hypothetical protein